MVKPRIEHVPGRGDRELGKRAVDLAGRAGLKMDDWQAHVLERSMSMTGGKWDHTEVGLCIPRQNGKNAVLEARELAELYLVAEEDRLVIHSAHVFPSAMEHFWRMRELIEDNDFLRKELIRGGIRTSNGSEGFTLKKRRRLAFKTRTKSSGRAFSCDLLVLDEAMEIAEAAYAALLPTQRARPNPQRWFTGSAVNQEIHENGVIFAAVRQRGIDEKDDALAYFEWSVEGDSPDAVPLEVMSDPAAWAAANPALGIRIDLETMRDEYEKLRHMPRLFCVELLGVGDWPRLDHVALNPIDALAFAGLANVRSTLQNPVYIAFDVSPDRQASVSVAGKNQHGSFHVEVAESKRGTAWVPDVVARVAKKGQAVAIVCAGNSPATSLIPDLEEMGLAVDQIKPAEHAAACSRLVDAVEEQRFVHTGQEWLMTALQGARTRPLGDSWLWSRRDSSVNISPLVSATLALSQAMTVEKPRKVVAVWA